MTEHGPTPEEFGDLVRTLRETQGLTAVELAVQSDLPGATIEALELGQRWVNLEELFALARGLGMTVAAMFRIWESQTRDN